MKSITVYFEDEDFKILVKSKSKSGLGWREFILSLAKNNNGDEKTDEL